MIKWIIVFALMVLVLGLALDVFACTTQTIVVDGNVVTCSTCGNVTDCF
jgi:hypothetical protein